ncbi:DUF4381 family protein [Granulosicoccus antarcticus]|uniref:DUF4381 domain-containing protein n=1 Tax=Granulosicoccus antarcticus IMCC3135 TaxID=1192854 RepID=A0A2Z2NZE1_9GAMM|nr:DUF4381 family protein [Granulosicoccus antarcticus]ASJ74250.1 hypothetical protein IMCC3135_20865 [Granulosicoccus antarcticus IMCC3135]
MNSEQLLSQLRDIQLPPAPESVPAWLIAANLLLLLTLLLGIYRLWRLKKNIWRHDALNQVLKARSMEPAAAMLALAKLLRQIMLHRGHDISKTGRSWLSSLDVAFDTNWFTQAEGQAFGSSLYRQSTINNNELQLLCLHLERLIKALPARAKSTAQQQRPHHGS